MRRGEVWRYQPVASRPGQSTLRLIVSARAVNDEDSLLVVLAVHVLESDPGGLLAVGIGEYGWASALTIEPVIRSRLTERVATVDAEVMEQFSAALRAVQDL